MNMKRLPTHPGKILRNELEARGLSANKLVPCLINCVSLFGNLIFDNALSFYAALARSCEPLMTASTNRM